MAMKKHSKLSRHEIGRKGELKTSGRDLDKNLGGKKVGDVKGGSFSKEEKDFEKGIEKGKNLGTEKGSSGNKKGMGSKTHGNR